MMKYMYSDVIAINIWTKGGLFPNGYYNIVTNSEVSTIMVARCMRDNVPQFAIFFSLVMVNKSDNKTLEITCHMQYALYTIWYSNSWLEATSLVCKVAINEIQSSFPPTT